MSTLVIVNKTYETIPAEVEQKQKRKKRWKKITSTSSHEEARKTLKGSSQWKAKQKRNLCKTTDEGEPMIKTGWQRLEMVPTENSDWWRNRSMDKHNQKNTNSKRFTKQIYIAANEREFLTKKRLNENE